MVGKILVAPWFPIRQGIWISITPFSSLLTTNAPSRTHLHFMINSPSRLQFFRFVPQIILNSIDAQPCFQTDRIQIFRFLFILSQYFSDSPSSVGLPTNTRRLSTRSSASSCTFHDIRKMPTQQTPMRTVGTISWNLRPMETLNVIYVYTLWWTNIAIENGHL